MDVLTLMHYLQDHGATLEPQGVSGIKVHAAPGVLAQEVVEAIRRHKSFLQPWVRGKSSCYRPGHLLPLDLDEAVVMMIYHYPLEAGLGIAQRKSADAWVWYLQDSPDPLRERGSAEDFRARLVELGVLEGEIAEEAKAA